MSTRDKVNELKEKLKKGEKVSVVEVFDANHAPEDLLVVADDREFPKEYDSNLGISKLSYKLLHNRAKTLFGGSENMEAAYALIPEKLLQKTEKTRAQVLLAYSDYCLDSLNRAKPVKTNDDGKGVYAKCVNLLGEELTCRLSDTDAKNIKAFQSLFQGRSVSEEEMKRIDAVISIYEEGYVAKCEKAKKEEMDILKYGRVMPTVTIEGCAEEKGRWIPRKSIEPNIPEPIPYKGR